MGLRSIHGGCGGRNAAHRRVRTSTFLTGSVSPSPCQFVRLSCSHSDSSSGRSMVPAYRIGVAERKGGGGNASARCATNSDGQEQEFPILVYLSTVRRALIPSEPRVVAFVRRLRAEICAETIQIQVQGIHAKNTVLHLMKSIPVPFDGLAASDSPFTVRRGRSIDSREEGRLVRLSAPQSGGVWGIVWIGRPRCEWLSRLRIPLDRRCTQC